MAEIVTLAEAVRDLVEDGQTVALEGFTHLIPHAAGHELIRQGRRDLALIRMTPDIVYDQLIGTGSARSLTFSWGGNPGVGSLHRLRDAVENEWPSVLELQEHSHAGMAAAYAAGASNLGLQLERRSDVAGAEAAYRRVLAIDPGHADAYLNLGALLCESHRCDEAVALYDEALKRKPHEALLHFNRAIALEDQGHSAAALASYHACLRLSPDLADAHYNAARLHQQLGDGRQAVRHFNAYRRLQRPH